MLSNSVRDFDSFYSPRVARLGFNRPQLGFVAALGLMAVSAAVNYYLTTKNNEKNREWHNEDQAHQDEREDTALTRRVQDAQNAGLSPLAALQTGAASSTPVSQAPAQAPSLDTDSLMNYITEQDTTDKNNNTQKVVEKMRGDNAYSIALLQSETQKKISEDNIKSNESIAKANRDSNEQIASNQLEESARQADNNLLQKDNEMNLDYCKSVNNNNALYAEIQASAQAFNAEQFSKVVDQNIQAEKSWCDDMGVTFKAIPIEINTPEDWKKYQSMLSAYETRKNSIMDTYQSYRNANAQNPEALASLYSKSKSKAFGGKLGANLPENMQPLGNIGKLGVDVGVNGQGSESEMLSKSEYNERLSMRALIGNQTLGYPVPKVGYNTPKPNIKDWSANKNYKKR